MEEIWKDIKDWEGLYKISNMGRVLCCERVTRHNHKTEERIKQVGVNSSGYRVTTFYDAKTGRVKVYSVHRLVAEAFIPNIHNKPCIDHIDGNPSNNCVENLRWCTHKENVNNPICLKRRSIKSKEAAKRPETLKKKIESSKKVKVCQYDLEGNLLKIFNSFHEVERELGYLCSNINSCCNKKQKTAHGFVWRYLNDNDVLFKGHKTTAKPISVYNINTGITTDYKSAIEASKYTGVSRSDICDCCKGRKKSCKGYKFYYKIIDNERSND